MPVHAGGIHRRHVVTRPAASVNFSGVRTGCSSWRATRMPMTPSLLSVKLTGAVECRERRDAIDRPRAVRRMEDEVRVLTQQRLVRMIDPLLGDVERAFACAALGAANGLVNDRPHLRRLRLP